MAEDTMAPVSADTQAAADELTAALKEGLSPEELLEQSKAANDAEFRTVARMIAAGRADDPVVQAMLIEYQRAYDNPSANPANEGFRIELAQQIANKQAELEQLQQQEQDPAKQAVAEATAKGMLSAAEHVCNGDSGVLCRQSTDGQAMPKGIEGHSPV